MNNKYIIKNCPAYSKDALDFCLAKNATQAICYNCTDCVIKQIVELCLNGIDFTIFKAVDGCYSERGILAKEILDLLDIQEVE